MSLPILNVTATIDNKRIGAFQLGVVTLCALVAMADGFDTQAIGFVAPLIAQEFNVPVASFGPVFGAGLLGLTIGALLFGPAADRFGRKNIVLFCTALFGIFAFATAWATSTPMLIALRLLTGIGLGGVMPNIITLTSEYSPARLRATMVSIMFCGFPLGAILGGLLSSKLVLIYGWKATFYAGGIIPLVLVPILAIWLPESIRYLASRDKNRTEAARIVKRMEPALDIDASTRFVVNEEQAVGSPVVQLFKGGRAMPTTLLWVIFFMNLLILYFLSSWLPTVLRQAGLPIERAIVATTLLYVGGMAGGVILAALIDRTSAYIVLGSAYIGAAVSIWALGSAGSNVTSIMSLVFVTGFCVIGAQLSINGMASAFYPTTLRSTGVGWALGIGRVGSIVGPTAGGILMAANLDTPSLFLISAIPAVIAASCIVFLKFVKTAGPAVDAAA